jgi:hypothetical protein
MIDGLLWAMIDGLRDRGKCGGAAKAELSIMPNALLAEPTGSTSGGCKQFCGVAFGSRTSLKRTRHLLMLIRVGARSQRQANPDAFEWQRCHSIPQEFTKQQLAPALLPQFSPRGSPRGRLRPRPFVDRLETHVIDEPTVLDVNHLERNPPGCGASTIRASTGTRSTTRSREDSGHTCSRGRSTRFLQTRQRRTS